MPSLKQIVEALVFASQKPLMPDEIVAALKSAAESSASSANGAEIDTEKAFAKTKAAEIAAILQEIKIDYIESQRAFQLVEQANGWTVVTDPACARWVRQLFPESKPLRLSGAGLETLAIIAYRQPVTRADIEAVRGVAVDGMVNTLLERGLIRIAGRADVPGRPLLYETTAFFLEHFGLKNLDELPNSAELRRVYLPTAPAAAQQPSPPNESAPAAVKGENENENAAEAAQISETRETKNAEPKTELEKTEIETP